MHFILFILPQILLKSVSLSLPLKSWQMRLQNTSFPFRSSTKRNLANKTGKTTINTTHHTTKNTSQVICVDLKHRWRGKAPRYKGFRKFTPHFCRFVRKESERKQRRICWAIAGAHFLKQWEKRWSDENGMRKTKPLRYPVLLNACVILQPTSRCLDIRMKKSFSCLIYCVDDIWKTQSGAG